MINTLILGIDCSPPPTMTTLADWCLESQSSLGPHITQPGKPSKLKISSVFSTECVLLSHHYKVKKA
jgi:hypothetical protein